MTVTFAEDGVHVPEGETAEIELRYRISSLAKPLWLTIATLDHGTTPADYEVSATIVEIPAGQATDGTVALLFTALPDSQIAEGEEVVALRLVPPEGIQMQLDQDIEVTVADQPGVPCPGLEVQASPVVRLDAPGHWLATTLALSRDPTTARVQFDWEGPYLHDQNCDDDECRKRWETRSPVLEVNVVEWRIESSSRAVRHSMDVEWFASKTAYLRFRSADGVCAAEPAVSCTDTGCALTE